VVKCIADSIADSNAKWVLTCDMFIIIIVTSYSIVYDLLMKERTEKKRDEKI
jgi:hypothetical protein